MGDWLACGSAPVDEPIIIQVRSVGSVPRHHTNSRLRGCTRSQDFFVALNRRHAFDPPVTVYAQALVAEQRA